MCHQVLNWVQMAEAWVDITEDVKLLLLLFLTHVIHYQMLFLNLPFILTTPLAPVGKKKREKKVDITVFNCRVGIYEGDHCLLSQHDLETPS